MLRNYYCRNRLIYYEWLFSLHHRLQEHAYILGLVSFSTSQCMDCFSTSQWMVSFSTSQTKPHTCILCIRTFPQLIVAAQCQLPAWVLRLMTDKTVLTFQVCTRCFYRLYNQMCVPSSSWTWVSFYFKWS